jgi:pilus assembly protein Flp/PilA
LSGGVIAAPRNKLKRQANDRDISVGEDMMQKALQLIKRFGKDENGAALVEYTVLLGVMLVAVIGTIALVGGWVNTKWAALWTALSAN